MEALLNAPVVVIKPNSLLNLKPKKHLLHSTTTPFPPNLRISKPLLLLSSSSSSPFVFNSAFAKALTYEEALSQSTTAASEFSLPDFDITRVVDGIINFGVDNPLVVAGAAAVLAVPIIVSQVFGNGKSKAWGVQTARIAYDKLGDDANAQLLDIRASSDIRAVGSPDIRGLKKKPVTVAYNGDDKQGFLKKLSLKLKEPDNTTLFIMDKFDGSSELVAELVTVNGFKAAYAIKDGAEGPRGWMNSGLPWILPKKSLAFDFGSLTDAFDGLFGDGSEAVSVLFGIAAATGLGLLAFTEVETILEVLGSAALVQLVSKKLLFAEDRKRTFKEVSEFVTAKIGPKDLLDDVKDIGRALLPSVTTRTLPAPPTPTPTAKEAIVEPAPSPPPPTAKEATVEPTPSPPPPPPSAPEVQVQVEAAAPVPPTPEIQVKEEASIPKPSRPLSPYPYYPNLKPPSSPTPSRP